MHKQISSVQNPFIKQLLVLQEKSRERRKSGLFIIEGEREITLALKGGYALKNILFCKELISESKMSLLQKKVGVATEWIEISGEVYQKIAYRTSTEGVIALAKAKEVSLTRLQFKSENPLLLIAEAPEKPGNIGALLRTADAAHLDAVIIANPKTDLYNPNIIRSSVGCLFTNTVATGTTAEIISFLKEKNISIYSAILQESVPYHTLDFNTAAAIVVGTEATGLSQEWREQSTKNIHIPMQGEIDSMNVSVAAGILIFEAKRQRQFKK